MTVTLPTPGPGSFADGTVVWVLAHEPEFDVPWFATSFGDGASEFAFVRGLGIASQEDRLDRLREVGPIDAAPLDPLHRPIGLELGARAPEETAVSIASDIVERLGGAGEPVPCTEGLIRQHRPVLVLGRRRGTDPT